MTDKVSVTHEEDGRPFVVQVRSKRISVSYVHWGEPTIVIRDSDHNELFFWAAESEHVEWHKAAWLPPDNSLEHSRGR